MLVFSIYKIGWQYINLIHHEVTCNPMGYICNRCWTTAKRPNCPYCYWNNNGLWKRSRKEAVPRASFLIKILLTEERDPEAGYQIMRVGKHELAYSLLEYVITKQKVMSTVSQRNRTGSLKGVFSNFFSHSYARWARTLSFHDTAKSTLPKAFVDFAGRAWSISKTALHGLAEPKTGHEFNQWPDLIWKFL